MKKVNLALVAFIIVFSISSCQQKYGYLTKVKVDNSKQEIVKKSNEKINQIAGRLHDKGLETAKDLVASLDNKTVVAPINMHIEEVSKLLAEKASTHKINKSITKKLDRINTLVKEKISKPSNKLDNQNTDKTQGVDGVKWMIAGLILILIGIVLGILISGFGGIVSWIGGVVFLIGLIFFLLDYLK